MKYKELLDSLSYEDGEAGREINDKVLLIDGLNLFFRNFSVLNMINKDGNHIGGLGGFMRSLGALVRNLNPTMVYIVFDGAGSSQSRKNIIPLYKSGRDINKITNWEVFDNVEEEDDAKIDQIIRIVQYLKVLPVKVLQINKCEADDVIAVLAKKLTEQGAKQVFMVTNDNDYIQLVTENIVMYHPTRKKFYTPQSVQEEFNIPTENFLIYKTMMGDNSDDVPGVKGLGPKTMTKLFPEIHTDILSIEDIFRICEERLGQHVIYARILKNDEIFRNSYRVMDLGNPLINDDQIRQIDESLESDINKYDPEKFIKYYNDDQLQNLIRGVEFWLKDYFEPLSKFSTFDNNK